MESVIFKAQPNRKSIPLNKNLILFFLIICLEIGSLLIYQEFKRKIMIAPLFFTAILRIADMILLFGFVFKWGYCFDHLGLSAKHFKHGIIHGLLWCLGFGLLVVLIVVGLYFFGVNPRSFLGHTKNWTSTGLIAYILVGCFLGPMVEDLLFTGLVYNGLRAKLNMVFSVLIVSMIFAFAHAFVHGYLSIFLIIQFIGGLLFTLSFEFSGSLLTPMIIHWCGNMAIFTIQIL